MKIKDLLKSVKYDAVLLLFNVAYKISPADLMDVIEESVYDHASRADYSELEWR